VSVPSPDELNAVPFPNEHPYTHISLVLVVHNEEKRLPPLLRYLRPYFEQIVVGVQRSDDRTRNIAVEYADRVVDDVCHGYGDATMPSVQSQVRSRWAFRVDADEWPSEGLLDSLSSATLYAEQRGLDGLWIPYRSWIDGYEWQTKHSHLRLWMNRIPWPNTLHSRPMTNRTVLWDHGYIAHKRTLTEVVMGYIGYWEIGRGNASWEEHNRSMMWHAIMGTAEQRGWDYVRAFPWWPEAEAILATGGQTWQSVSP
jgi:hypothetical protein